LDAGVRKPRPHGRASGFWGQLTQIAGWWARIGTAGLEPYLARRLAVINVLSAMVSVMTMPYIVLYAVYDVHGLWIPIVSLSPQVFLYASAPWFHRFGTSAAAIWICILWICFAVTYTYYFGRDSGLQFYFLPGAAASMLVFGPERLLLSGFITLLSLAGFLLTEIVFVAPAAFLHIEPWFLQVLFYLTVPFAFLLIFTTVFFAYQESARTERLLEQQYAFSERLLESILPRTVALQLKDNPGQIIAEQVAASTILFADIVDFTPRASRWQPEQVVEFLNRVFKAFDSLAEHHNLEKIKTIGDAYMVAGGLPLVRPDHAEAVAAMALDIMALCRRLSDEMGERVEVRIGIETGPVIAGVIGRRKPLYDVWGDTVNTAARMESHGRAGHIQVTDEVKRRLDGSFAFTSRGVIDVKGKGLMQVWFLTGRLTEAAPGH